jgi:hypothetical protein
VTALANDLERMTLHIDTSFTFDARGRMLLTNEPGPAARKPAPRVVLGRTPAGKLLRLGADVSDDVAQHVAQIVASLPPLTDLDGPPPAVPALRAALGLPAPGIGEYGGPAYHFPAAIPRLADAIQITRANVELAADTYPWLLTSLEEWWPCFGVVRDSAVVSVCFSSRLGDEAAAAGVDTRPEFRQRGFAAAATAGWGAAIRAQGREPFYSTGWDNLGSQAVARRVGLIAHGATTSYG